MKKNNLLIVFAAVATMFVAAIGAAYAYFATSTSYDNSVQVTATMPELSGSFSCVGSTIALSPTSQQMSQAASASGNATISANNTLVVKYRSGDNNANLSCTYDIVYQWDGSTQAYTITAGTTNEFTYQATGTGSTGVQATVARTQFVNSSTTGAQKIANGTISSQSASTDSTQTYSINVTFTNFKDVVQAHEGKVFKVNFKCANVVC